MNNSSFVINKGSIFIYRLFDIANEIDLKKAQPLLEKKVLENPDATLKKFKLQRDPHRTIIMRDPPLSFSSPEEELAIQIDDKNYKLRNSIDVKMWDYGVLSLCFKLDLPCGLGWFDLIKLGSLLDNNAAVDEVAIKRRAQISSLIEPALKHPNNHAIYEDYLIYVLEEVGVKVNNMLDEKVLDPHLLVQKAPVSELIFFEPEVDLSENTQRSLEKSMLQYSKKDLLVFDWNSALIVDFTDKKDYQDTSDLLEFSLTQLLELRVYDNLLDEKLDVLYTSMENKTTNKKNNFYSAMAADASQMYIEFSDFFDKIDNSLKTVGDIHLAKILKSADRKFGFDELKRTMFRKMDTLANICKLLQDKIDSEAQETNAKISHRQEFIIIVLILLECIPLFLDWIPKITEIFK